MTSKAVLSIREVNALSTEQFAWLFSNVVEHCPEAARHAATKSPFESAECVKRIFEDYLDNLDLSGKIDVLNKHPDLTEKLNSLTRESQNEQTLAGLTRISEDDGKTLRHYSDMYREKFQFPFVICARENNVKDIFEKLRLRLNNSKEDELNVSLREVKKICSLRINDLIWPDQK